MLALFSARFDVQKLIFRIFLSLPFFFPRHCNRCDNRCMRASPPTVMYAARVPYKCSSAPRIQDAFRNRCNFEHNHGRYRFFSRQHEEQLFRSRRVGRFDHFRGQRVGEYALGSRVVDPCVYFVQLFSSANRASVTRHNSVCHAVAVRRSAGLFESLSPYDKILNRKTENAIAKNDHIYLSF